VGLRLKTLRVTMPLSPCPQVSAGAGLAGAGA